jgi:hypothetical protein
MNQLIPERADVVQLLSGRQGFKGGRYDPVGFFTNDPPEILCSTIPGLIRDKLTVRRR